MFKLLFIMKKYFRILAVVAMGIAAMACASVEKMQKMAENVKIVCEPAVLEVIDGEIDADVTVTYPKDYFHPKAILEVTPVIVYQGGEAKMKPFIYQGTKVKDNFKVVSSDGQKVSEHLHFDYVEGMEKCYLELRGVAKSGSKSINLPSRKVADGANTTYMLVKRAGQVAFKADNYQETIVVSREGQILYQVNSADVRASELRGESVREFQEALAKVNADDRATIKGTEIVSYASPEGSEDLNNNLSGRRGEAASKAWKQIKGKQEAADPTVRSVGEDWEGFRELVAQSNLEDKDLILRVLSMYSDPAVRESEIRNMSQVFTALKSEVLPELRRARLIANVEYQNYTSEELLKYLEENADILDEEALLRTATLVKDPAQKESIYKRAVDKFASERAQYNLAALYLSQDKLSKASDALSKLKDQNDADVLNAKGVLALRQDDLEKAEQLFVRAGTPEAKANRGVVDILTGNYDKAASELADVQGCCHNTALAYLLTDQLGKAEKAIHCQCPKCIYLKAIIAARQGDAAGVSKYLSECKSDELLERAKNDIEFAGYEL